MNYECELIDGVKI